jgi:alginate O-acetyltransferase complex protein AlgI
MLFTTWIFTIFFCGVWCTHWLVPQSWRHSVLLVASYGFYMAAIPSYLVILLAQTGVTYLVGRWIATSKGSARRRNLWLGVTFNVLLLGIFKYLDFTAQSLNAILHWLPIRVVFDLPTVAIILPLGISFFTFEFIHYLIVVERDQAPVHSLLDVALFAAFFPTQIAGPIKRFPDFMRQLAKPADLHAIAWDDAIWLILRGLVRKVIIADTLAPVVADAFSHIDALSMSATWFAIIAFSMQIYGDFAGYTDIGRGCALLLGFQTPENFMQPYLARDPSEFWHRWHITLSQWLRDYVYIPLGGSRVPRWRIACNLLVTMIIGGLWHGAAWHFVIWGFYQGCLLVIHREWRRIVERTAWLEHVVAAKALECWWRIQTFILVCVGWIFFRSASLPDAWHMLATLVGISGSTSGRWVQHSLMTPLTLVFCGSLAVFISWVTSALPIRWLHMNESITALVRPAWMFAALLLLVFWPAHPVQTFIYFQF